MSYSFAINGIIITKEITPIKELSEKFGISAVEITEEPTASFDKNTFKPKAKKCKGCGNTYVKDSQETVCPYCQRYN